MPALETFANPGVSRVEMRSDGLTRSLPRHRSARPVRGDDRVLARRVCIESKSPTEKVRVTLEQKSRGGITITAIS